MSSDREAREQIVQIAHEFFFAGHLTATGGNISARSSDRDAIWITPRGLYKGGLGEEDLVLVRPGGEVLEGINAPSIEYPMHFASYRARPEAAGAVHTHSPIATAFGICGQRFEPITADAVALADTVTVPWHMPGSEALAEVVGSALEHSRGVILQNHGLMAVGDDLRKAATRAAMIEETARVALYVKQFGGAVSFLPDDWIERLAPLDEFI
jgi:L-ribulose-5-phosphate 4-epimerase